MNATRMVTTGTDSVTTRTKRHRYDWYRFWYDPELLIVLGVWATRTTAVAIGACQRSCCAEVLP